MGGYASTPKKGKISEEGSEGRIRYAASGMQGWRAGMEDAHVALMKVPKGSPPSAKEIAAARISSSARQHPNPQHYRNNMGGADQRSASLRHSTGSTKAPLGDSHSPNIAALNGAHYLGWTVEEPPSSSSQFADAGSDGSARVASARVRSFTYSAGDLDEDTLPTAPPVKGLQQEEQAATATGAPGDNSQMDVDPGGCGASSSKTAAAATAKAVDTGKQRYSASDGSGNPKATGSGSGSGIEGGGTGEQGWKAVDLLEDAALFGVFDGHGGKAVAEFARDRLPGLLAASPEIRAGDWKKGFPQVYHAIDALLLSGKGQEKVGGWGGGNKVDGIGVGCTIVTALVDRKRGQCYVAHAGDSRCVLSRNGRAVQLTRDHKPNLPTEYSRIVAAGGHVSRVGRVNDNLNLSRAIGDMSYKRNRLRQPKDQIISAEPDVCRFTVTPGVDEFLVLACDGIWEMMDSTQVVNFVRAGLRAGNDPLAVVESLLDACLSPDPKGTRYAGCDNMTAVLVLLEGWETTLATRAHPPAVTFAGGRLGSVAEAAVALSTTVPKLHRRLSEPRKPLPTEFIAASKASKRENQAEGSSSSDEPGSQEAVSAAAAAVRSANGRGGHRSSRRRSEADSAVLLARRVRAEAASGWTPRRLTIGGVSRPRTAQGIEFSLASFDAPPIQPPRPRSRSRPGSTGGGAGRLSGAGHAIAAASGSVIAAATAAGARPKHWLPVASPDSARRSAAHHCSETAPMLPTPLIHHRRAPSDDKIAAAAAVAAFAEVGAAGAAAMVAANEENIATEGRDSGQETASRSGVGGGQGDESRNVAGDRTGGRSLSEDGVVFMSAPDSVTPVEVTVTAAPVAPPAVARGVL